VWRFKKEKSKPKQFDRTMHADDRGGLHYHSSGMGCCSQLSVLILMVYTGWSKITLPATHIKICIDGCNSISVDWIN
jgi:hypothetical protein